MNNIKDIKIEISKYLRKQKYKELTDETVLVSEYYNRLLSEEHKQNTAEIIREIRILLENHKKSLDDLSMTLNNCIEKLSNKDALALDIYNYYTAGSDAAHALYVHTQKRNEPLTKENSTKLYDEQTNDEFYIGFPALKDEWIMYHTINSLNHSTYIFWAASKAYKINNFMNDDIREINSINDNQKKIHKFIAFYDKMSLQQLWRIGY